MSEDSGVCVKDLGNSSLSFFIITDFTLLKRWKSQSGNQMEGVGGVAVHFLSPLLIYCKWIGPHFKYIEAGYHAYKGFICCIMHIQWVQGAREWAASVVASDCIRNSVKTISAYILIYPLYSFLESWLYVVYNLCMSYHFYIAFRLPSWPGLSWKGDFKGTSHSFGDEDKDRRSLIDFYDWINWLQILSSRENKISYFFKLFIYAGPLRVATFRAPSSLQWWLIWMGTRQLTFPGFVILPFYYCEY